MNRGVRWRVGCCYLLGLLVLSCLLGCSDSVTPAERRDAVALFFKSAVHPITQTTLTHVQLASTGHSVVLFWAPWCEACQKELFLLNDLVMRNPGLKDHLLLVALDHPDAVHRFLTSRGFHCFTVWSADRSIFALLPSLGDAAAAIPFALNFSPHQEVLATHLGLFPDAQSFLSFFKQSL